MLVDSNSVYVFADSADLDGRTFSGTPDEFAAAFDGSIGVHGRYYELLSHDPRDGRGGYHVYRVDDGVVLGVIGGQDQETIAAVERDCQYVGFVGRNRLDHS